ncbi:hypothetical protein M8J75_003902 [Diaphorina citri]|nr:hypothetical protein M8J75_003902 [Diaphorina citri]KAI5707315.1 hypothetical protein M8J77_000075 [Diaphorina citri]
MPRIYKRRPGSRKYADYTSTKLEEVLRKLKSKEITQRQAEKQYEIPRSTLKRKLKGESLKKPGGQPVIDLNTEEKFKDYIVACSMFGFPLATFDVRILVKTHLDRNGTQI